MEPCVLISDMSGLLSKELEMDAVVISEAPCIVLKDLGKPPRSCRINSPFRSLAWHTNRVRRKSTSAGSPVGAKTEKLWRSSSLVGDRKGGIITRKVCSVTGISWVL